MGYLANLRVVRTYFCKKYNLPQGDFELLFKLHDLEYFTWDDFVTGTILLSWNKPRWYNLKNNDWIKLHRAKEGKHKRYNIYCLTLKAKTVINKFYRILEGKDPIPSQITKKAENFDTSYSDKVTATAIRIHNTQWERKQKE